MNGNTVKSGAETSGYTEKLLRPISGYLMLAVNLLLIAGSIVMIALGGVTEITAVVVTGFLPNPLLLFLLDRHCVGAPHRAVVLPPFG